MVLKKRKIRCVIFVWPQRLCLDGDVFIVFKNCQSQSKETVSRFGFLFVVCNQGFGSLDGHVLIVLSFTLKTEYVVVE